MHAQVPHNALDLIVSQIAIAAMQLQGVISDFAACVCGKAFLHSTGRSFARVAPVNHIGGAVDHEACGGQIGCHIGQLELRVLEIRYALAKLFALFGVGHCLIQRQTVANVYWDMTRFIWSVIRVLLINYLPHLIMPNYLKIASTCYNLSIV